MTINAGLAVWKTAFAVTPIILCGGVAEFMPFEMLPLVSVAEAINSPLASLSGANLGNLDEVFATFMPVSGGTLVEQEIARYPFANQTVAANAVIGQPLRISMMMICPARNQFGYFAKLAIMTALQTVIEKHNNRGGTYIVATPSYIYTNCVFRRMSDISSGISRQPQASWLLEFEQPLVTLSSAQGAQSSMIKKLTRLTQVNGPLSYSGQAASVSQTMPGSGVILSNSVQGIANTVTIAPLAP